MKTKIGVVVVSLLLFVGNFYAFGARGNWNIGDWVSWSNFRYVTSVAGDYKYLYFGTTGGVMRFNKYMRTFEDPWTTSDGLADSWVVRLYYDQPNDEVVIDTKAGLSRYNLTFQRWYAGGEYTAAASDNFLPPDKYHNFFLDFGYSLVPGTDYIQDIYLQQFPVSFAYQEDNDNVWLAAWGLGLALGNSVTGQMRFLNYGLDEKSVKSIYIDGQTLYLGGVGFGSPAKGVTKFNRQDNSWEYWEPISNFNFYSADVNAITGDSLYVWLGTKSGLVRYSKKEKQFRTYTRSWGLWENEIAALKSDGKRLWVGTTRGLNVMEPGSDTLIKVEFPGLNRIEVRTIEIDSSLVWVGTDQGVFKLDLKEKTREKFVDPYGVVNTRVNCIVKSGDQLWFASRLGILRYDTKQNQYKVYSLGVDIPGGEVLQIAVHPYAVWAATTGGAAKLDRSTNLWHLYTEFDGILNNYVETVVLEKDYVWFGTPEGLTRFHWYVPGRVE